MKRWQKVTLALLLAVTVWMAVGFWVVGTADCVVRVSFTGLNNIFHIPFEYYAVRDTDTVRVPYIVAVLAAPEAVTSSEYEDEETAWWYGEMIFMPRKEMFDESIYVGLQYPWIDTDFSESHRIYYHRWSGAKRMPDDGQAAVMRQAFHYFHDGDSSDYVSLKPATGEKTLASFMFVSNGENLLVEHGRKLYMPMDDGTFQLIMECGKTGRFDYYWFP